MVVRAEGGLSQGGLAQLADMHRAYAGRIERGERIDYLYALADALGLSPRDLFQPTRRFSRIARTASPPQPMEELT